MTSLILEHMLAKTFKATTLVFFLSFLGCSRSAQEYVEQGNRNFDEARYEQAALDYRKAIQQDPQSGEAFYRLGLAEAKRGRQVEAYRALEQAAELGPDNAEVKLALAEVCLNGILTSPSIPDLLYRRLVELSDEFLANDETSFHGLRLKGYLGAIDQKPQEAAEFFGKANDVKPMVPDIVLALTQALIKSGRAAEGELLAREFIAQEGTFSPIYNVLYQHYMTERRLAEAEDVLKDKVAHNPEEAEFVLQLAGHYQFVRRTEDMQVTLQGLLNHPEVFPEAHVQVGDFHTRARRWEQARRTYEAGADVHPDQATLYKKRIAVAFSLEGNPDEALETLNSILDTQEGDDEALAMKANLLLARGSTGDLDTAKALYERLIQTSADNPMHRISLGRLYEKQGNFEGARTQFREALDKRARYLPALLELSENAKRRGRPKEVLTYAEEGLQISPGHPVARLLRAYGLAETGRHEEARGELLALLAENPDYHDARMQLGLVNIAQGRLAEAEQIFQQYYKPGLSDLRPLEGLVEVQLARKRFAEATMAVQQELAATPVPTAVRTLLARTAARAGEADLGIAQYEFLIAAHPTTLDYYLRLAEMYESVGESSKAIATLENARKLSPDDPDVALRLGYLAERTGGVQEAGAYYRKVLSRRPDDAIAQNNLANILVNTGGDLDEALSLAQRAQSMLPDAPEVADTLGWIYLKMNNVDSALQVFSNLVRTHPANPTYRYHLGATLLKKGNHQQAREELEAALANSPPKDQATEIHRLMDSIG